MAKTYLEILTGDGVTAASTANIVGSALADYLDQNPTKQAQISKTYSDIGALINADKLLLAEDLTAIDKTDFNTPLTPADIGAEFAEEKIAITGLDTAVANVAGADAAALVTDINKAGGIVDKLNDVTTVLAAVVTALRAAATETAIATTVNLNLVALEALVTDLQTLDIIPTPEA